MTFPESPEAFGAALKAERLRKGLNLAAISQATKIAESNFVSLERGDLRHWPRGIFRRSFFSDYVRALGLPVEPALTVFARVFPDASNPAPPVTAAAVPAPASAGELRLSLAASPWTAPGVRGRAAVATGDAAFIALVGGVLAWVTPASAALTIAVTALIYYSLVTILGTDSLAARLMAWARRPTWPVLPTFQGAHLPTLAVPTGVRERSFGMRRFIPHVDMAPLFRALRGGSSSARAALARVADLTRTMSITREASTPGETDTGARLHPVRGEDASQLRHERRLSTRTTRSRSSSPSVRVRIRLTR